MSAEKRLELNIRKSRVKQFNEWLKHANEPEKPQPTEQTAIELMIKRDAMQQQFNEDNPHKSPFGEGLEDPFNTGIFKNETPTPDKDSSLPCEERLNAQLDKEYKRITKK